MTFSSLLNNNILLQTKYSSQNDFGEWTYTYSGASTATKCRISPLSMAERIDNTGMFHDVTYKCFCLSSAGIVKDSRVNYAGDSYRIKEVLLDSESHHKTALLVHEELGPP